MIKFGSIKNIVATELLDVAINMSSIDEKDKLIKSLSDEKKKFHTIVQEKNRIQQENHEMDKKIISLTEQYTNAISKVETDKQVTSIITEQLKEAHKRNEKLENNLAVTLQNYTQEKSKEKEKEKEKKVKKPQILLAG